MTRQTLTTAAIAAAGTLCASALFAHAQLGPLDPPDGPVSDTGPSLAELASSNGQLTGPWESRTFFTTGNNQLTSIELQSGPVLVHKVIANRVYVSVFDGPGTAQGFGQGADQNILAQVNAIVGSAGDTGRSYIVSHEVQLNVIAHDGLHVAWDNEPAPDASFTVLFRPLSDD